VPIITTNDFRNGITIIYNGKLYQIVYFQHIKPGKGHAFVRTRLKDVNTGQVIEPNFRSKEPIL
jgi:elongation factor P